VLIAPVRFRADQEMAADGFQWVVRHGGKVWVDLSGAEAGCRAQATPPAFPGEVGCQRLRCHRSRSRWSASMKISRL